MEFSIRTLRPGDTARPDPFTICIIANPALEEAYGMRRFVIDPITTDPGGFDNAAAYVDQVLFGELAGQAERFLGEPYIAPRVRVISAFPTDVQVEGRNSLVSQLDWDVLWPRRDEIRSLLSRYGLAADIVFAVSASSTHTRATAMPTTDDDARPGVPFTLNGQTMYHRFYAKTPGTIALHVTAHSLTALHECGHALGSYGNGQIVDLYLDGYDDGVNNLHGRPIPVYFSEYDGTVYMSDPDRDSLGYPPDWTSYHCALNDPRYPAVMDNYWEAPGGDPLRCQHDQITRRFLLDRVRAKLER